MSRKIVIVGGVAGGASAAARLRRLDEHADIVMFERDGYISFANCGLPYYIGETIEERDKLLVQTPDRMKERFNIDVRIHSEVVGIDPERHIVKVKARQPDGSTMEYEESYDDLILSPGAKPLRPPIPGIDLPNIYTLRNIPDTDKIKQHVDRSDTRSAVVVGGGFIGVEMAESLRERGLDVTLVEAAPHILAPFDADMVTLAEQALRDHGVKVITGNAVASFEAAEGEAGVAVFLQDGLRMEVDLVIFAVGVVPDVGFVEGSGIARGARGHIIVNEHMQTSVDRIYAVGDAVEVVDFVGQGKTAIPLAGPANKQGRIAADHICGLPSRYQGSQGTSIIKIFDLTAASTGLNERTLQRLELPYRVVHIHPGSHANYYPGAEQLAMKLLFADDGRIYGAQVIGKAGVDKRIDVIATVMRLGGTVYDLTELEHSYAPPYSSAKDPVNMLGFVAENVLQGLIELFTVDQLKEWDPEQAVLVDVRSRAEHERGHIAGSMHLSVDELRERLAELPQDKEIWVYCQVGLRGYLAARILSQHGFKVKSLSGGYRSYEIAHLA